MEHHYAVTVNLLLLLFQKEPVRGVEQLHEAECAGGSPFPVSCWLSFVSALHQPQIWAL